MKDSFGVLVAGMFFLLPMSFLYGCDEGAMSSPAGYEDITILSDPPKAAPRNNYQFVPANISKVQQAEPASSVSRQEGKLTAISYDTGQVTIENPSGNRLELKAGHDIDLKSFSEGDQIRAGYNSDGFITSLVRTNKN